MEHTFIQLQIVHRLNSAHEQKQRQHSFSTQNLLLLSNQRTKMMTRRYLFAFAMFSLMSMIVVVCFELSRYLVDCVRQNRSMSVIMQSLKSRICVFEKKKILFKVCSNCAP